MKLPLLHARELCGFLEKEGFVAVRQRGSHKFYRHPDGRTTVVPVHPSKPIGRGLLRAILQEIGMGRKTFMKKMYPKRS